MTDQSVSVSEKQTNIKYAAGRPLKMRTIYWKNRYLVLMLIPVLIHVLIFNYIPLYGIIMAFKDNNFIIAEGIWKSPWVGLANFERIFSGTSDFWRVLRNTLTISLLRLVFVFPAGLIVALLLNEIRNMKFKRTVQNITYLPHFLSWVIIGSMLVEFLSPSRGLINELIKLSGAPPIYFLADKNWFVPILLLTDIWQSAGWGSIVYLAAISGIDPEMYESSIIDGAGRFRRMLSITLPSISNVVAILFVLAAGSILSAGFDQIFNLYNPSVYEVADILDTYVYRVGLVESNYSFSTAVGLFKNVIAFTLVFATNKLANRYGHIGLW